MQHHGEVLTAAALPPSLVDGAASSPLDQTLYGLFPGEGASFVICMNHKHAHALHITHTHAHIHVMLTDRSTRIAPPHSRDQTLLTSTHTYRGAPGGTHIG